MMFGQSCADCQKLLIDQDYFPLTFFYDVKQCFKVVTNVNLAFVSETITDNNSQSVQRFVTADEIAELAWFLAGPAARSISGQIIPIDGDSRSTA